jgi:prepilin-type N-terminal cleavage/methylation domain-containing protein
MKTPSPCTNRLQARSGFTLLEMLAVILIMGILMSIAATSLFNYGRIAGFRGSVLNLRSNLALCRQYAITKRMPTSFQYDNETINGQPRGYYCVWSHPDPDDAAIKQIMGTTNYLAEKVCFRTIGTVPFKTDGGCDISGIQDVDIVIYEDRDSGGASTTRVYRVTGRAKTLSDFGR